MTVLERLMKAKLSSYTLKHFERFRATENEWGTSRRKRVVLLEFITVYELWENRLLARKFAMIEGYENKQRYAKLHEVQRILAGESKKLTRALNRPPYGFIYTVDFYENKWKVGPISTYQLDGKVGVYTSHNTQKYNDPNPILAESIHKYCGFQYFECWHEKELFDYIVGYAKHPQLEILVKMGLKHIYDNEKKYIRWSKSGPQMLGLEKEDIKYLQERISLSEYRDIREFVRKHHLSVSEMKVYNFFFKTGCNISLKQVQYLAANNEHDKCQLYKDYLEFMDKLGVVLNSELKYPVSIKNAHDQAEKNLEVQKNKENDKKIKEQYELYKRFEFEHSGLIVYPCSKTDELIQESKELGHCVRGYANSIVEGKKEIMFIRKKAERETSYFTVEMVGKRIKQCRGLRNCSMDDEIKAFVERWINEKKLVSELEVH